MLDRNKLSMFICVPPLKTGVNSVQRFLSKQSTAEFLGRSFDWAQLEFCLPFGSCSPSLLGGGFGFALL